MATAIAMNTSEFSQIKARLEELMPDICREAVKELISSMPFESIKTEKIIKVNEPDFLIMSIKFEVLHLSHIHMFAVSPIFQDRENLHESKFDVFVGSITEDEVVNDDNNLSCMVDSIMLAIEKTYGVTPDTKSITG